MVPGHEDTQTCSCSGAQFTSRRSTTHRADPATCQTTGHNGEQVTLKHPKVREKLISIIADYECVFTDDDVAVGKTDLLKIKIVLQPNVTPVRVAVRKIKPQLAEGLQ